MKLLLALVVLSAFAGSIEGAPWFWEIFGIPITFTFEAAQGAGDMAHAYWDLKRSRSGALDKYYHARGNYDAAQRGPGGRWAAKFISNTKERFDRLRGDSAAESAADQEANEWGRNGGDPNKYLP